MLSGPELQGKMLQHLMYLHSNIMLVEELNFYKKEKLSSEEAGNKLKKDATPLGQNIICKPLSTDEKYFIAVSSSQTSLSHLNFQIVQKPE